MYGRNNSLAVFCMWLNLHPLLSQFVTYRLNSKLLTSFLDSVVDSCKSFLFILSVVDWNVA